METFLLFANGGGSSDPLNWSQDEAILLSSVDLISIRPTSASTLEMVFNEAIVELTVRNRSQIAIMKAITVGINSSQKTVTVLDRDSDISIHPHVQAVSIKPRGIRNYIQTLANNSRTAIPVPTGRIKNCMITNIDGTDAVACTLELHDGSTYTKLLDQLSVPAKSTLVLESGEISFDDIAYTLHATSGDSGGQLTFTFNY